jgi:hypothetical protein
MLATDTLFSGQERSPYGLSSVKPPLAEARGFLGEVLRVHSPDDRRTAGARGNHTCPPALLYRHSFDGVCG